MNAICIAMTFFAMDPTAEDFTKYFDRAAKTKIEIIQKAEDKILDREVESRAMSGPKLANAKRGHITMKRELEKLKDAKPFAFMSAQPVVGDMGMIEKCIPVAIIDNTTVVASISGEKEFMAILTVDSTKDIKRGTQEVTPDYVWVVTEVHDSKNQYESDGKSESMRAAVRYIGLRRFFVATAIKKAELESHRKAYEAEKKDKQ